MRTLIRECIKYSLGAWYIFERQAKDVFICSRVDVHSRHRVIVADSPSHSRCCQTSSSATTILFTAMNRYSLPFLSPLRLV